MKATMLSVARIAQAQHGLLLFASVDEVAPCRPGASSPHQFTAIRLQWDRSIVARTLPLQTTSLPRASARTFDASRTTRCSDARTAAREIVQVGPRRAVAVQSAQDQASGR